MLTLVSRAIQDSPSFFTSGPRSENSSRPRSVLAGPTGLVLEWETKNAPVSTAIGELILPCKDVDVVGSHTESQASILLVVWLLCSRWHETPMATARCFPAWMFVVLHLITRTNISSVYPYGFLRSSLGGQRRPFLRSLRCGPHRVNSLGSTPLAGAERSLNARSEPWERGRCDRIAACTRGILQLLVSSLGWTIPSAHFAAHDGLLGPSCNSIQTILCLLEFLDTPSFV
ncbi:hypothetical protein DFH06DRAFT_181059 [Mycena polygramma]|nr:hypothetical protein DFH06DRAFT_181059 [Mycena polygramma]